VVRLAVAVGLVGAAVVCGAVAGTGLVTSVGLWWAALVLGGLGTLIAGREALR